MKHISNLTLALLFLMINTGLQAQSMQNVIDLVPLDQATHTATASGDWESSSTWGGSQPGENSRIVIPNGVIVTINSELASEFEWIRISNGGKLAFNPSVTTLLKVETIVSGMSGEFEMGTASTPIASNHTATVIFSGQNQAINFGNNDPGYLKRGAILMGKTIIHGEEKSSWHALTSVPAVGATSVTLAATPINWKVGDRIVITGTNPDNHETEEVRTIESIDGSTISFSESLKNERPVPPGGANLRVHIANLSRNILFTSEYTTVPMDVDTRGYRGHIMVMHSSNADIRYARFYQLGRTNKQLLVDDWNFPDDLPIVKGEGFNVRGRYSIHFHRSGVNPNGSPAILQGCAVEDDPGWAIVNHSSNVEISDNVTYNIVGGAYQTEAGDEVGSFDRNIAIRTVNPDYPLQNPLLAPPGAKAVSQDFSFQGDGFWIHGGGVSLEGNVASGSSGHAYIYWPEGLIEAGLGQNEFLTENIPNGDLLGDRTNLGTHWVPAKGFKGNIGYSASKGFASFYMHTNFFGFEDEVVTVEFLKTVQTTIEDMVIWNVRERGIELNYTDRITFKNNQLHGDKNPGRVGIDANQYRNNFRGSYVFEGVTVTGFDVGVDVPTQGEVWFKGGSFDNKTDFRIDNPQSKPRYLRFDDVSFSNTVYSENEKIKLQLVNDLGSLQAHVQDSILLENAGFNAKHPIFFAMPDIIILNYGNFDNERVYFNEQTAGFIPVPNPLSYSNNGFPVNVPNQYIGKTNQELLDQYRLAFGGAIMPSDAREVADVSGGKISKSSPITAPSGMFAPACTYSPLAHDFQECWSDYNPEQGSPLTVTSGTGGSVTVEPAGPVYEYGQIVKVQAIPDQGFEFKGWSGPTNSTNSTTYIEVTPEFNHNGILTADFGNAITVNTEEPEVITQYQLHQNYPNPFNPSTNITFSIPEARAVNLEVFDMLGRKVSTLVNQSMSPGRHTINFNASGFSSGVYIYRLQVGNRVFTKKMMLIK